MTAPVIPIIDEFADDVPPPPLSLSSEEEKQLSAMKKQLQRARRANRIKNAYYEAKQKVRQLDIAIPPQLRDVEVAVGWPGTVVDVLEERIDLMGYTAVDDLMGLDEVYTDNFLGVESSRATVDSLWAGVSFASVGRGDPEFDEPDVVISAESPNTATLLWDYRKRRAAAGLSQTFDDRGRLVLQSMYVPGKTIKFASDINTGRLEVIGIDTYDFNRVLMTRLLNRDRASDINGRSEITLPIRYYTDAAVRTMLGMEVNREFYTTPMRAILDVYPQTLGFSEDMSEEEKKRLGWSLMQGHLNIVPPQGDNNSPVNQPRPSMVEFKPSPPTPYIEQIKAYSIQVSGESGMPASMLGFVTDNPTSGDAILKGEYRLVRRAERRIQSYDMAWKEVALLALLCRGEDVSMADMRGIRPKWRNPAVPTRAAEADATQKLVASEVLPPRSKVTWNGLGISDEDQKTLEQDWLKEQARQDAQAAKDAARSTANAVAVTKAKAAATPAPAVGGGQPGRPNTPGGPTS